MMLRVALGLVALGILSGTAVGVIRALTVLHAWGWSGPALALRVLGRHTAQALFIGLVAAVGLSALGWLAHRVYPRWLPGRLILPGQRVASVLWLSLGALGFVIALPYQEAVFARNLPSAPEILVHLALVVALVLGLGLAHRVWTGALRVGNDRLLLGLTLAAGYLGWSAWSEIWKGHRRRRAGGQNRQVRR